MRRDLTGAAAFGAAEGEAGEAAGAMEMDEADSMNGR
jgi:hypothetical protein